jgi:PEP-CTERM motif
MRICGNIPATSTFVCTNPTDAIGVAFTYGTPFELSVALDAVAGGGLGGSNISGGGTLSYSLPSQSDVLSTVPEPTTTILMTTGMFALLIQRRYTM